MANGPSTERGSLLLADVAGYTAFLAGSELDHAQAILGSLFNTLLAELRQPWRVCEVEGDAIFAYAPEGTMVSGPTLLEVMETLYSAFATSREQMQRNTTCACTACRSIAGLDLKLVAHHGTYALQRLAGQTAAKPSGPDVILAHRLLKNTIKEQTGVTAYAFVTQASVDALDLREAVSGFQRHGEEYPHLGRVEGYVHDLHPFWAREKERKRIRVVKEDAWIAIESEISAAPQKVWEYLHDPVHKRKWREADDVRVFGSIGGRRNVGTTHHCVHGDMVIAELVVDWRPFSYFTCEEQWPMRAITRSTTSLTARDHGTRLTLYVEKPRGRGLARVPAAIAYVLLRNNVKREQTASLERLRRLVEAGGPP